MARGKIKTITSDLTSDDGGVLWSQIIGEQLELPVTVAFVEDVTAGYVFEAVVMEADNFESQNSAPSNVRVEGVNTTLIVRLPVSRGVWDAATAYNSEELVTYNGLTYERQGGVATIDATAPDTSPVWIVAAKNVVYVQFPKTLGANWSIRPSVTSNVYGFFEISVTEPSNSTFVRTWKPVRGMVELLFSPTQLVN
jgi:hypothetical protein